MEEKVISKNKGLLVLSLLVVGLIILATSIVFAIIYQIIPLIVVLAVCIVSLFITTFGIKIVGPQEAAVYTLFGNYYGIINKPGIYFINPFCSSVNPAANTTLGQSGDVKTKNEDIKSNKISLKVSTLCNGKQKVNDVLGNPIDIAIAITWRVIDPTKAVFNVENYKEFLSLQCDSCLRNVVRIYPYDVAPNIDTTGDGEPDEGSLRGSSAIVAEKIKKEIQLNVENAGIEILGANIIHLAYSTEIASAMLQRQQARAIIDARAMIVDGAVGMVDLALKKLLENDIVNLDEERKAAMVSNLLVVLCSNKDSQPVINSGSIY